ncbi:DNA gyrase inhibitor [Lentzea sp. NBRC 105346]|uniref:GyrI-like domain-containing protein n=1 Tax=Lentzea sp. NBRC 105346 TaxID=3032205 RepID=UPI0024A0E294|nr:GyrI-like domain-containing protein [Lentzea sp. NBRC 105346]GLZ29412.1 DNA gyrase inhibitor [Lentzea sp. NBRC 105346]
MKIEERPEQLYVGIRGTVTMTTFAKIADRIGEIVGWLADKGVPIAGAPFFRYLVIDMEGEIELEAGVPVEGLVETEADYFTGELPAGHYATLTHHGHPDQLVRKWDELLTWAAEQGELDVSGQRWGSRTESYLTHPAEEPDPNNWDIELAVRVNMP